ncbi:MAG: hypothetical protein JRJ20_13605 [Deltaproteobacteria bacterium]|nr:hypothetical protein [Deltaproteobacteria bacterium]
MRKKYYLIEVLQGVEPVTHGPFQTEGECDNAAQKLHKQQRADDSLFWAIADETGGLTVGSYLAGFFMQD